MKMTIDLPRDLIQEVKSRAINDGQRWEDIIVELLRKGLDVPHAPPPSAPSPRVQIDPQTGLPIIACDPGAPARGMSIEQLLAMENDLSSQRADVS
jgi:hypothetical protein